MEGESTANAKIEKCVLAEVLQTSKWGKAPLQKSCKHQNEEKRPCRSSANTKMRKSVLAEVLQTPKWGKAPLQKFCKHQNEEKRPCRSPANAKMGKSVLAEVLQTPKWEKALLQKFCKRQNGEKHFCRNAAKPRNFFEVFAGVPQVPRKTFWPLRESRKHLHLFSMRNGNALLAPFMKKIGVGVFADALEQQATRVEISNPYTLYLAEE